jgi:co-chaperonin GroES (HSP10)
MGQLIITGDRVLIEPHDGEKQTESGLVLPATVAERDKVGSGRVIRVGPGYLTANPEYSEGEPWAASRESVRYLPLQAQPGDFVFFVRKEAVEISYRNKNYLIVHHAAILAIERPSPDDILSDIEHILEDED